MKTCGIKIEIHEEMGLCKHCGSGNDGKCGYHRFPVFNYRKVPAGECSLTVDERQTMMSEHNVKRI